jgi:chromate transporter
MFAFASGYAIFHNPFAADLLHGLQLVAVAVVAQAVLRMAQTLTPDLIRILMAVVAGFIVLFFHHPFSQLAAITAGAIYGLVGCRTIAITPPTKISLSFSRRIGTLAFGLFVFLLLTPSIVLAFKSFQAVAVFQAFYRTGALVFGGGHVVLPLLQTAVVSPGWIDETTFLAGYGGAQALPGPLFTFAAYLGALLKPQPHGLSGAALGLIAIFLPGLLLVICILPFWSRLRANPNIRFALAGINASVVGILAAALYRPVFTSSVRTLPDYLITFLSVLALLVGKVPLWIVLLFTTTIAAILPGILRAIH